MTPRSEQAVEKRTAPSPAVTTTSTATTTAAASPVVSGATTPATVEAVAARAEPRFDIDGDGRDELVIGAASSAGRALIVRYSATARQEILTPPAIAEPEHDFGHAMTLGDFNGDGFQDLAVTSYRMISQGVFEHGLFVYPGSAAGLDRANVDYLPGLHAGTLASGDLNGDGRDDLAVGDNDAIVQNPEIRGVVTVLSGTADGLATAGAVEIRQVAPRWSGLIWDEFGTDLVISDFTGDGYDDLVVAGFRRGETESDSHGIVTLFPGSPDGPDAGKVSKIEGAIDTYKSMPVDVMTMSDMNHDGRSDLILGLPRYDGGEVWYLPGVANGLSLAGHRVISQDTPGIPGQRDNGIPNTTTSGHFGYALATGDATGDGRPDLLVGAIAQDVGTVSDTGTVTLIPGTSQGPTGAGSFVYAQSTPTHRKPNRWNPEPAEVEDYLGSSVAILDLDGVGPMEMFAEAMYEDQDGMITSLRLQPSPPRRDSTQPTWFRLAPVKFQRPADFSESGVHVYRLRNSLLSR